MALCSTTRSIPARSRALRVLCAAGLAIAVATAACVKVDDLTGAGGGDGKIAIALPATSTPPGSQFSFTVSATDKNGNPVADGTPLALKSDSRGAVTPAAVVLSGGSATASFTAGPAEGNSTITATGAGGKATATVKITRNAVPPTGDAIPFSQVRWIGLGGSVSHYTWNQSTNLRVNSITNPAKPTICWSSTIPSNWPVDTRAGVTAGNLWVIIKHTDNIHYGAPIEWLLKAQGPSACTTMENIPPQPPFIQGKEAPVATHYPRSGEELWFMMTSLPRPFSAPANIPNERSSIVAARYP